MGCGASASQKKYEQSPAQCQVSPAQQEILQFLAKVPLFKHLPEDEHPLLAKACEPRDFTPGQVIIRQGEIGKEFFVIRSGEASVHLVQPAGDGKSADAGQAQTGGNLKVGDYFGEKALVQDIPRSATIKAETNLSTLMITRLKFRELGLNEKFHFHHRKAVGKKPGRTKSKEPTKKTAAERLFISEALKQNENLQVMVSLDDERVSSMVDICWKENISGGKTVISEDDTVADSFYVIQDGLFTVSVKNKSQYIKKLGAGTSFGEMALLCLAPRSATIQAQTDSVVWVFDRDNFKKILMRNTHAQIGQQMQYLEGVELLKCLLPSERRAIAEAFLELHYEQGENIVEQGKQGTAFYVLFEGALAVFKDGKQINTMSADVNTKKTAFFGEMALLNNEPRTATVQVTSAVAKLLALDRESFDMLLGPLDTLIKEAQSEAGRMDTKPSRKGKANQGPKRAPIFRDELTRVGLLGCGGFGAVELCEHKGSKEVYALKCMSKGYIVQSDMQTCVMQEKEILWMCDSPFIIRLHATYNVEQSLELLLEVALGGDLHILYQRKGLYGSKTHACFYSAGVACAFQHLHGLKVVYRDLKPENVLVNTAGHVKLTDMGLAKICLGKTYTVCGTPDYFAPEMLKQTGHSFSLDWWTLGVFIFEMLAGFPPFEAHDPMQCYRNIVQGIGKVLFPPSCMTSAQSLIRGLLADAPMKRLPMLSGGISNLQQHGFYTGLNWTSYSALKVEPPYKPVLNGPKDRRNFRGDKSEAPPKVEYKDDGSGWDRDFASHQ